MGKWTAIIDDLPKYERVELRNPVYRQRVDDRKREIVKELGEAAYDLSVLANSYIFARKEKKRVEKELKQVDLDLEAVSQLFEDRLDVQQITGVKLESGDAIRVQSEPHSEVEEKDKVLDWWVKQGLTRSLQIPWQSFNALMKTRLEKGEPIPEGVKVMSKSKFVWTKPPGSGGPVEENGDDEDA
jgi:hypothetical protein